MRQRMFILVIALVTIAGFTSCSKDNTTPQVSITSTQTLNVNFSTASKYALFSFKDSAVVANTDSASSKWDFGLRLTSFIVNSNASGPGSAGVIVQDGVYSSITAAPSSGYAYDTTSSKPAIKDGTWYDYNPQTHAFVPKAGKVFLFRTADGAHYAKMQLLSVDYAPFTGPVPATLLYKFQYTYQTSGSTTF